MASNIVRLEVHKNLRDVLEDLRKAVASDMKREFGIDEISVPRTLSSQILAAKCQGKKVIDIKIKKTGVNSGILELL